MSVADEITKLRTEVEALKMIVCTIMALNPTLAKLIAESGQTKDDRFDENVVQFGTAYGKQVFSDSKTLMAGLAQQALDSVVLKKPPT